MNLHRQRTDFCSTKISFRFIIAIFGVTLVAGCGEEMVDVGGHKLQILRSGKGSPTVVFESGGARGIEISRWRGILSRVGEITSAVCYARAGRAGSEPTTGPRTPTAIAEDLHTMLERAGYSPPYVLVGASNGGIYVRVFAMKYPGDVAGLVLVDGVHEREPAENDRRTGISSDERAKQNAETAAALAEKKGAAATLEQIALEEIYASGKLGIPGRLPDVPMVVLTSTRNWKSPAAKKFWTDMSAEFLQASSNGKQIVTDKAGHMIQVDDPDMVVEAIRWVIDAARKEKPPAGATQQPNPEKK